MTQMINEDLKEMLSFHEPLALLCFNINYARRFESITLEKLSVFIGVSADRLEKACRILTRAGMAKISRLNDKIVVEMTDPDNSIVKNTIFDVMWEKKDECSVINKAMMQGELSLNTNY